ncbi:Kinesin- protein 6 [Bulinus truncatus]|nr:Kinesin- protein 6 [Bulinus truncatus]
MAQIKTYARLKPSKRAYPGYEIANNVLTVHIPDNKDFLQQGSQQPIRSNISYDIVFTDIFRPEATQEEVFDGVARDIIQNFLNGYNGTIFAYGQTGTGKTYTVEGNSSGHNTRGLATRALSMIYQQLEKRTDEHISVYLSYLEIYQEVAYDLLNPASRSSSLPMAPFAKVTVVEGPRGSCILRGLSLHLAANEEIAQMLLFQGQTNRKVAETPVNQRSSRSHAVFTVYLQVRKHESEVLVNSKLHLVDLAGSERVSKTGVDGQQLTEAKSINLSLHHLETVIIALQSERTNTPSNTAAGDKSKGDNLPMASRSTSFTSGPSSDGSRPFKFVPYRNSLLTMVLKDSLGGNCLTAMIATISLEPENLGESISTCRFAQRVARIANNARRNEEIDDKTLIRRLKHKVADLENQVARLRSKGKSEAVVDADFLGVLTEEDRLICAKIMEGFLQGVITDPVDAGICDQCRFRECLHFLKHQCLQMGSLAWPPKTLSQQVQQQERETASDHSETVLPNNPHRDSGDHVMNTTSQGTSPIAPPLMMLPGSTSLKVTTESAQQSSSEATIHSSDDFLLDNPDIGIGQAEGGLPIDKDSSLSLMKKMSGSAPTANVLKKGDKQKSSSTDRKKEADPKKVGKKVNRPEDDRLSKQEHLDKIKLDALLNELTVTENNLSLKLHVTDEQVVDQHAYLAQLKQLQADPELISKELLVEKHLLKRQAKFREKLSQVVLQKSKLERSRNQDVTSAANSISSKVSMDELSGTFKQNKGPVNTKLVYDLLRAEEKGGKETAKGEKDALDKLKSTGIQKKQPHWRSSKSWKHILRRCLRNQKKLSWVWRCH